MIIVLKRVILDNTSFFVEFVLLPVLKHCMRLFRIQVKIFIGYVLDIKHSIYNFNINIEFH